MSDTGAGVRSELGVELDEYKAPDLSPEDIARHSADLMANALEGTRLIEIVETQAALGQVHFMCRVEADHEHDVAHRLVHPLLLAAKGRFDLFAGKQFLLNKQDDLRFAWVIGVGSDDLYTAARVMCDQLEGLSPKLMVMEAPLLGSGTPQGSVTGGKKGAVPVPFG